MKLVLLLALLAVGESDGSSVVGQTGQSVTLSCKYDISKHGAQHVCWGRGELPNSGCGDQLVSTDGHKVRTRASSRYQLLGRLEAGDVSLTILDLTETDAGRYGCRVEIPGWFNDDKHHLDLIVERAAQATTSAASRTETSTEATETSHSAGHMTSTERLLTPSISSSVVAEQDSSSSSRVTVVLVVVLFGLLALVTAAGAVIIGRRWKRLNKIPQQQQVVSSIQYYSTSATLELRSGGSAVENIYQIDGDAGGDAGGDRNNDRGDDGGDDGGEYEYCP
ncbi:T-cell immunoglobulin and mucin domain-containing protein 4-like isoform X1 [Micropterus dolomieu]|uniref:T-cell immunoglobulin and mucin domain-containing protein 4-like isoform X1 n=1 Tax=Micropterus dolomieu TaxID=147949 RepID=UPI001E8D9652|nr:T-cell immunoglobulin and mucin domain-containing protein 4-like isoform X1 [Micropterus dolomieu]